MSIWVIQYSGVPPDTLFTTTQGFGTPVIVDSTTGIAYYYKEGTGVQAINSPSASGISDHGGLTGLADDDHSQYHTDARGDLRYTPLSHAGSGGSAHSVATSLSAGFMSTTDKILFDALSQVYWDYLILDGDITVASATPSATIITFTPDPSVEYIVEGELIVETSVTDNAPCPGVAWPSGLSAGVVRLSAPTSSTGEALYLGNTSSNGRVEPGTFPANTPLPARISATFLVGASPSGDFTITLSSRS